MLVKITIAEVDRCHFTIVSTSSHAADSERADISNRPNFAYERSQSVHPRGCGRKWLHEEAWVRVCAPSACRVFICELMSRERAQRLFVPRFSWWWRGRCMDMPMCVPDFRCLFEESVTAKDVLRTSRVPASSVCTKNLGRIRPAGSCSRHTERLKLVNEVPKDQGAAARKCANGKNQTGVVSATNDVQLSACLLVNGLFHCQASVLIQFGPACL